MGAMRESKRRHFPIQFKVTTTQAPLIPPTMARRPFLISLTAMSGEFWPAGSKGNELMNPDCESQGKGTGVR